MVKFVFKRHTKAKTLFFQERYTKAIIIPMIFFCNKFKKVIETIYCRILSITPPMSASGRPTSLLVATLYTQV